MRGTEAAFQGVVPTGAHVALTVPGAAVLTVAVHQGWWAGHCCRQRMSFLSMAPPEGFKVADHLTNVLRQK